jgi:hypothetical protein
MAHPVRWERPVGPEDLRSGAVCLVDGGAQAAGAKADALVLADRAEHSRRLQAGLGGVTSLLLIDALMNLPLRTPVHRSDLDPAMCQRLEGVPKGVVLCEGGWFTRLLTPPLTVVAVVVRARGWRESVSRIWPFAAFAQQILLLDEMPVRSSAFLWEAQLSGIGVWAKCDGELRELLAPEPFTRRYWKPAGWRFVERAYRTQIISSARQGSSLASPDRRVRIERARSGRLPPELPET